MAGTLRGRRFDLPPDVTTRPTGDRVRQATFNALDSLDVLDGAEVVDAYAGSGALGIEALSRGARHANFAERDPVARSVLDANLAGLGLTGRSTVVAGDGARVIVGGGPWDLVLLDPPYAFEAWPDLLASTAGHLRPGAVVVVESDREVGVAPALHPLRVKQYGGTVVTFATATGAPL